MPGFLVVRPEPVGVRVAVTRPRHRAAGLCAALRSQGFVPVVRSLVRIEPMADALTGMMHGLAQAASQGREQWIVLTSVEAVRALDAARRAGHLEWPVVRVACVGPATATAAARAGLDVTLVPSQWDGDGLAAALRAAAPAGALIHWPRAEAADPALKRVLMAEGAEVVDVVAYRTAPDLRGGARLERDLRAGRIDAVLLLSPSAVDAYAALRRPSQEGVVLGVIGQSTGARARAHGLAVHVEPAVHGITALVEQLRRHVTDRSLEDGREQ